MDADPDPVDDLRAAAIEQFDGFGLSPHAVRTFAALVSRCGRLFSWNGRRWVTTRYSYMIR